MHAHTCDDFYLAMKRKEISPPVRTQITPESIVLSESSEGEGQGRYDHSSKGNLQGQIQRSRVDWWLSEAGRGAWGGMG